MREELTGEKTSNLEGAIKTMASLHKGNSNFWAGVMALFFSACLPAAIARQSGHGYLPSNVRATASWKEVVCRFSASMPVQATVWSNAQWPPRMITSATVTKVFPKRTNTAGLSDVGVLKSRKESRCQDNDPHRPMDDFGVLREEINLQRTVDFGLRLAIEKILPVPLIEILLINKNQSLGNVAGTA